MLKRMWWLSLILVALTVRSAFALDVVDVQVRHRGEGYVDSESVLAFTSVRAGDEFNRVALSRDVKLLQNSDRYTFVSTEVEQRVDGVAIIYVVEPKLHLRSLRIEGAETIRTRKLRRLLELPRRTPVDDATLAVRTQKIIDEYHKKHFPYVDVDWTIEPDNESGAADVVVRIDEGRRASVRKIKFEGIGGMHPKLLRKQMQQKQWNPLSIFTKAGTLDVGTLQADVYELEDFYRDAGYQDVKVQPPELLEISQKKLDVYINIDEGDLYTIGDISVKGAQLFDEEKLESFFTVKSGDVASQEKIEESAKRIRDFYGAKGYVGNRVQAQLRPQLSDAVVDVELRVREGKLGYIRDVIIEGNTQTKDLVIRRELSVFPGDIANEVKVKKSESRIRNLGLFSFANSRIDPTADPDQYDVTYEVEEGKSGQFVAGAGFSSVDDIIGFIELSQGNFDIFGWPHFKGDGQKLKLRTQLGTKRSDYEITFIEPWLFNRRISMQLDGFRSERRFLSDEYDQRNIGGGPTFGRSLGGPWRASIGYKAEEISVFDVDETASDLIKEEEGDRTKSSMTLALLRDTRNSSRLATRGSRNRAAVTGAGGLLGMDTELYRLEGSTVKYFPVWIDHVLSIKGWGAVVEEYGDSTRVPIFDRLFLGGARTVRGFKFRDIGPKDERGEPIGGRTASYATAEYTIPLFESFRLAGFYDVGMVWSDAYDFGDSWNSAVGTGIRIDIPGFPLRLDYGWPLEADEFNDSSGRFSFWIGYGL